MKLHRTLKPEIENLLEDRPDHEPLDEEDVSNLLDQLPCAAQICKSDTFATPLAALTAMFRVVHLHVSPIPEAFLSTYDVPAELSMDRHFYYNMWMAHLTGARVTTIQNIINAYIAHEKEPRFRFVEQSSHVGSYLDSPTPARAPIPTPVRQHTRGRSPR